MKANPIALLPLALAPAVALGQEARSPYDAATAVVPADAAPIEALLDFDGDGDTDLACWQLRDDELEARVQVWANAGDGTFALAFETSWATPPGSQSYHVPVGATGDRNGDGLDDFAVAQLHELRVFTSNGAGFTESLESGADWIYRLAYADLDGDALADLAALREDDVEVRLGDGGFVSTPNATSAFQLSVLEADGDPEQELLTVRLSAHEGTILALTAGQLVASTTPEWDVVGATVDCGDVDGDGDDDIVAFGLYDAVQVLRRTGPATFAADPVHTGGPGDRLFDADGDGDLDGVRCEGTVPFVYPPDYPKLSGDAELEIALGDGAGQFALAFSIHAVGARRLAGVDDLDGDGQPDLAAGRCVYFGRGPLLASTQPDHGELIHTQRLLIDFDGDGDTDLPPDPRYPSDTWATDGDGRFLERAIVSVAAPAGYEYAPPYLWGDFDGDGDQDLLASKHHDGPFKEFAHHVLLANNGGGGLEAEQPATFWGEQMLAEGLAPDRSVVADLDLDGDLDVAAAADTAGDGSPGSELWLNDGTGSFELRSLLPEERVELARDLNADGNADLVVFRGDAAPDDAGELFLRRGAGPPLEFSAPEALAAGHALEPWSQQAFAGDFDDDGDDDVSFVSDAGVAVIALNPGPGGAPWSVATPFADGGAPSESFPHLGRVLPIDVDLDGTTDAVVGPLADSPRTAGVWRRLPGGPLPLQEASYESEVVQVFGPLIPSDADGDGDVDFFGRHKLVRNKRFAQPDAGLRRQYGEGNAGAGSMVPTLGAVGPFRGGETMEVRLVGAVGGTASVLAFATSPASIPGFPFPATTALVDPFAPDLALIPMAVGGPSAVAGSGGWSLELTIAVGFASLGPVYHQVFVLDTAAVGSFTASNGLELRYGNEL